MIESLKGKVEEHLIEKTKKIYEETHVVVKIPEGFTKKFRTRSQTGMCDESISV